MASAVLIVIIALLVLMQGGFFPLAACAVGVAACVAAGIAWLCKPQRSEGFPLVALLFAGVALAYLASALSNGVSLTTLAETGAWGGCAGAAFLAAAQDAEKRTRWMRVLAWFGVATAVAGVVDYAGLLPLVGGVLGERLQFTFQYANAAAAWYGVCALLCLLSPDVRLRAFAAIPAGAMLLTESGGALVMFVIVAVAVGATWVRSVLWERVFSALVQAVLAIVLFAGARILMSPLALIVLAVVGAACWWITRGRLDAWACGTANDGRRARMASLAIIVALVVCAAAALILLPERLADAGVSLGERLAYLRDGVALWLAQPVLGVGPDNWQYLYPYIQTAPYYTTVVHCSYVQMLLDAGVIGFILFAAACVFGLRALFRQRKAAEIHGGWVGAELAAAAFLLAHALVDFDLQFASLAFVAAALLSLPDGPTLPVAKVKGLVAGLVALAVCLPISALGLVCASTSTAFDQLNASGDYARVEQLFWESPLAHSDVGAQSTLLAARYGRGDLSGVTSAYGSLLAPTDRDAVYAALAYYAQNDKPQATAVIIDYLERHPYGKNFLDSAVQLVEAYGIDQAQEARFEAAVTHAQACQG